MARTSPLLRVPRLDSIRSRILALAILGTLIPTGLSLGIAYVQNRRALEARVTQNLLSASTQSARATGVWLKERLYDLRIFASSEEVLNNVNRYAIGQGSIPSARLREYLRSLQEKYPHFELGVLDVQGRLIAGGGAQASHMQLPAEWQKTMRQENQLVGGAHWDERGKGRLLIAVPVTRGDGQLIGAFGAELSLDSVHTLLVGFASAGVGRVYLTNAAGNVLASSDEITPDLLKSSLPQAEIQRLVDKQKPVTFANAAGEEMIGIMERVPQSQWAAIAEMTTEEAYAEVRRFRNIALFVVVLLLAVVGGIAHRLGQIVVRPLERLASGATVVATGDLDVELPVTGEAGEVDSLTSVFNNMVRRLRQGRQQLASVNEILRNKNDDLERLAVTDGLTGLENHRALMQRLAEETLRAKRSERTFCVMMADVDFFKKYNDEFGHPAGDQVLKQVAVILKESTRTVDCVARYGGEEFAALLPETPIDGGAEVAERIRARVAATKFDGREITLSIGVAEFPKDADTATKIIAVADKALYEAKRAGRNQVARAKPSMRRTKAMLAVVKKKPAGRKKS